MPKRSSYSPVTSGAVQDTDLIPILTDDGDGTYTDATITKAELEATLNVSGAFYVPAAAMKAEATDGAPFTEEQTATNDNPLDHMLMASDARDLAVYEFGWPSAWGGSTVRVWFRWTPASGATAGETVVLGAAGVALGDGDTLDSANGAEDEVQDTVISDTAIHLAGPVTVSIGSPQEFDTVFLKFYRDPTDTTTGGTGDSMNESLKLLGVWIGPPA